MEITKQQYEYSLNRIEELLPLVTDETPASDKPTIGELISLSIEEKGMTQKQLAEKLGVSPSRVSDYISGRAEPTLRIARAICLTLGIAPAAMLGM